MTITNEIFINNVYYILQQRGINRIGDFEKDELKVSVGYFSRLKKDVNKFPELDILLRISGCFGISIDMLVYCDLRLIVPGVQELVKFIEMLKNKTKSNDLVWSKEIKDYSRHKMKIKRTDGIDAWYDSYRIVCIYRESKIIIQRYNTTKQFFYLMSVEGDEEVDLCSTENAPVYISGSIIELVTLIDMNLQNSFISDKALSEIVRLTNE